jgi:hypothetical protein
MFAVCRIRILKSDKLSGGVCFWALFVSKEYLFNSLINVCYNFLFSADYQQAG